MKYSFSSMTMKRWTGLPFHSISTLQIRARQPVLRPGQGTDAPVERTWNLRPSESSIHLNFGSLPGLSTTLTVTGVIFALRISILSATAWGLLTSVAPDRGKEFANHREVSRALGGVPFYFCQSHHPWQKPTVENTSGPIREFFPKGTDFSRVTDEEVQEVFEKINDRPRKALGFRTANEVYREMLHSA